MKRNLPARKPLLIEGKQSVIVFLTVCIQDKQSILANDSAHNLLRKCWGEAEHWRVGRYIIMPDHIHLFCAPAFRDHLSIRKWVSYWKSLFSKQWPQNDKIWQRDCWDTQLRSNENYSQKWDYVRNNPVRAGLVSDPNDWRFQGELNLLRW